MFTDYVSALTRSHKTAKSLGNVHSESPGASQTHTPNIWFVAKILITLLWGIRSLKQLCQNEVAKHALAADVCNLIETTFFFKPCCNEVHLEEF